MYDGRDTRKTTLRSLAKELYNKRGIVPARENFYCPMLPQCSKAGKNDLITGNWIFIGCDYGSACVNGYKVKILFVAMDRGGYEGADTETFKDTQKSFRSSIEYPRNPHMGGVALILKHLTDEQDAYRLSGQCALTNAVKCARRTGKMSTRVTNKMISSCAAYLKEEIFMLAPNIIVTQGKHPASTVLSFYNNLELIKDFSSSVKGCLDVWGTSKGLVILRTPHPARQKGLSWRYGILPNPWKEAIAVAREGLIRHFHARS